MAHLVDTLKFQKSQFIEFIWCSCSNEWDRINNCIAFACYRFPEFLKQLFRFRIRFAINAWISWCDLPVFNISHKIQNHNSKAILFHRKLQTKKKKAKTNAQTKNWHSKQRNTDSKTKTHTRPEYMQWLVTSSGRTPLSDLTNWTSHWMIWDQNCFQSLSKSNSMSFKVQTNLVANISEQQCFEIRT